MDSTNLNQKLDNMITENLIEKDVPLEITEQEVCDLLDSAKWTFAKSMPENPHDWSFRGDWKSDKLFVDVVRYIRRHGVSGRFFKTKFIYFFHNGFKYWTMGNPVSYKNKKKTYILNRAKA